MLGRMGSSMVSDTKPRYEFGPYRLDSDKRLLLRDGRTLALQPKTFDLLLLLVESRGRTLSRGELMKALWSETFVEEANLSFQVSLLRRTLGDHGNEWIETVPKHGYRFNAVVSEVGYQIVEEAPGPAMALAGSREFARRPEVNVRVAELVDLSVRAKAFPRFGWWPLIAAALALTSLVPWVVQLRKPAPHERTIRFSISPSDEVTFKDYVSPAISSDGQRVVFVGLTPNAGQRLWIRALDSLRAEPLAGTELADSAFWSPDGQFIGFFADGKLKTVDPRGTSLTRTLCDAPGGAAAGTWSRNGTILFQTRMHPQLYKVSSGGGRLQPATALVASRQEIAHFAPQFLPDGRHFIYFVQSALPVNTGIYVGELDSNRSRLLVNSNTNAAYAENAGAGYLLFAKGTTLLGQSFNPNTLQLTGSPFLVAQQLMVTMASGLGRATFSASENGVLIYRTGLETGSTELLWFDRHGNRLGRVGEPADYYNPALSPDEKKLAVALMDSQTGTRDVWIFDLVRGTSSRFTFDPADETNPVWSPDGARVAFTTLREGRASIYQKDIMGTSGPRPFLKSSQGMSIQDWSRDGRFVLFKTSPGTWVQSLADGPSSRMLLGEGTDKASSNAEVSPDGRWVAYQLNEPDRSEVYLESLKPNGGKWQVSLAGGIEPHWRRDGKELFYLAGQKLMAVPVQAGAKGLEVSSPRELFEVRTENLVRRSRYQVAANGEKFLVNVPVRASSPINVAVNWTAGR